MGEARRRGTFEERREQAMVRGRDCTERLFPMDTRRLIQLYARSMMGSPEARAYERELRDRRTRGDQLAIQLDRDKHELRGGSAAAVSARMHAWFEKHAGLLGA